MLHPRHEPALHGRPRLGVAVQQATLAQEEPDHRGVAPRLVGAVQRIVADAKNGEREVEIAEAMCAREAQQELPVLRRRPGLVEAAGLVEGVAPERQGRRLDRHLLEKDEEHLAAAQGHAVPILALAEQPREDGRLAHEGRIDAAAIFLLEVAEDGVELRMAVEEGNLVRQLVGAPQVVGVEERHQGRPRVGDAEIAGGGHAGVAAEDDPQPPILDRRQQGGGGVRGAVVHHDALEVGHGLPQHARDRVPYGVGTVIGGDDHRAARRRVPVEHDRP